MRNIFTFLEPTIGSNPSIRSGVATCGLWAQCQCRRRKEATLQCGLSKLRLNKAPALDKACVTDWLGGYCPADSLMVWFPAHWAPRVIQEPERREQEHCRQSPQWFDEQIRDQTPDKYRKQYQDARDCQALHFRKREYLKSPIHLLTASIRVDWYSLPMQNFLDRLPKLRLGLIKGIFQTKASSPWAGTKSGRIQVSLCLPNERDLDTWYEGVFTLPLAWPDITDIHAPYFKKTSAYQLLAIRNQRSVPHVGRDQPPMGNAPPSFMEPGPRIPYGSSRRTAYPAPALSTGGRC